MTTAALLDEVIETLYARHTADADAASVARREYEERRGKVHQEDGMTSRQVPHRAAQIAKALLDDVTRRGGTLGVCSPALGGTEK